MGILNLFGKKNDYEPAEIYLRLRSQVLSRTPSEIHALPGLSPALLGVLMESGYPEAVVTLVTIADGTVSLYFSNGGGIIGIGEYERVRKASVEFLSLAERFIAKAQPTNDHPLPSKGYITFYFITSSGLFFATAKEKDLENKQHPLFLKAHKVISEARDVDRKRKKDFHEFMNAVTTGNETKVSELLHILPNPDISDPTGLTPLMAGAFSGHNRVVQRLLDAKATIDQKDSEGYTALMFACNAGKLECVRLLVEHGAKVNETAADGSTPIMFAAQHGFNDVTRYLLGKGADPTFVGKHGLSAIGLAKQNKFVETEMILLRQK
jgi:hypothetical protein